MRKITAILILFIILSIVQAHQTNNRYSLLNLLVMAKEDMGKAMLLFRLVDYYEANNQDSAVYYSEKSKTLSDSLKFDKGLYRYYERSAIVSFTKGDYGKAMEQQKTALAIAR